MRNISECIFSEMDDGINWRTGMNDAEFHYNKIERKSHCDLHQAKLEKINFHHENLLRRMKYVYMILCLFKKQFWRNVFFFLRKLYDKRHMRTWCKFWTSIHTHIVATQRNFDILSRMTWFYKRSVIEHTLLRIENMKRCVANTQNNENKYFRNEFHNTISFSYKTSLQIQVKSIQLDWDQKEKNRKRKEKPRNKNLKKKINNYWSMWLTCSAYAYSTLPRTQSIHTSL